MAVLFKKTWELFRTGLFPFWKEPSWFLLFFCAFSCTSRESGWTLQLEKTGTYSSPRAIDLNEDGIKDLVMGAGGNQEWQSSGFGVLAVDGRNGQLLWTVPCRNQLPGSPVFLNLNNDNKPDIIIGGRSAQLMAISGADGRLLWEFLPGQPDLDYQNDTTLLNFFTPQLLDDWNGDGFPELLISYGGFVQAPAYDPMRPAGYLAVISSSTGQLLYRAAMPDGKETYMSPVVLPGSPAPLIVFGTGGETLPGRLYLTPLSDLLDNSLNEAIPLAEGAHKGFIAPPVLADITADGRPDIIACAYEGRCLAFDGATLKLIWSVHMGDGYETHAQPAPGYFNQDEIPDFFVHLRKGEWPNSSGGLQLWIDGKTGKANIIDSLGGIQMSSPIVISSEKRPVPDQVLMVVNQPEPSGYSLESGLPEIQYTAQIIYFNIEKKRGRPLKVQKGMNVGATPLLDDLDQDGRWELIWGFQLNPFDIQPAQGLQLERIPINLPVHTSQPWNQYMGPEGKSTFR